MSEIDDLRRQLEQLTALVKRGAVEAPVAPEGSKCRIVRIRDLAAGLTLKMQDDGFDVDGHGSPKRDHGGRALIREMLSRRVQNKRGEDVPVFVLAEPVAPRFPGDPIAFVTVYGGHNRDAEAELVAEKKKSDERIGTLIKPKSAEIKAKMAEAKKAAAEVAS